jgi:FAD/FMN-containing dehydrogenase
MNGVRVDPAARTADVGGGASAKDLLTAAGEHGLVASTGTPVFLTPPQKSRSTCAS